MRTTLDIDDALLAGVQARFPPGTPKTVLVEEGLRRLLSSPEAPTDHRDPRLRSMIEEGLVVPGRRFGPYVRSEPADPIPMSRLLADLATDREDR